MSRTRLTTALNPLPRARLVDKCLHDGQVGHDDHNDLTVGTRADDVQEAE